MWNCQRPGYLIQKILFNTSTKRPEGKNTFGIFPRKITAFSKLENAILYTGDCFILDADLGQ